MSNLKRGCLIYTYLKEKSHITIYSKNNVIIALPVHMSSGEEREKHT